MKQNKRVSTCVLILVLVAAALFVLPAQVRAETVTESQTQMETFVEGDYTYTVDKEEATIISCATSVAGEVVVPERLGGFPVVEIAEKAFAGCSGITQLTVPDCVRHIGLAAFTGCGNITSMTIPFVGESRKTSNDTYQYPFGYIFGTEGYTGGVQTMQYYIADRLGSATFAYYRIPRALKEVNVTGGHLLYSAFDGCANITTITLGDGVASIGAGAFDGCSKLAQINIGKGVKSIAGRAFSYCDALTSIVIPENVTDISADAFSNCSNLNGIWVSDNNPAYSSDQYGVLFNKDQTRLIAAPKTLASYTIGDHVQVIGKQAFRSCYDLKELTMGTGVQTIEEDAFMQCYLDELRIKDIYAWWKVCPLDGFGDPVISASGVHIVDQNGTEITEFTVDPSVKEIPESGFRNCKGLTEITISNGVEKIGYNAFYNCEGLTEIIISDSVQHIGSYAFENCTALTTVTFGKGLRSSDGSMFEGCTSLMDLHISDLASWCQAELYTDFEYSGHLYLNGKILTKLVIPDGITKIGACAFSNCTQLTSISIPKGVKIIGESAFRGCSGVSSVIIPGSVTEIGDFAFADCTAMTKLTLPTGLKNVGLGAFRECTALREVVIPSGMKAVETDMFDGCTSLKAVYIPKSVTSIRNGAFRGCSAITDVYYADSRANWTGVDIDYGNNFLKEATIHYNHKSSDNVSKLVEPVVELAFDAQADTTVLTWDIVPGADWYDVYRATSKSGSYKKVATAETESWQDTTAAAGNIYYYKVKAVCVADSGLNSGYSNIASVVRKCAVPELGVANNTSGKPVLTWNKVTGAKKYEIWRSVDGATFKKLTTVTGTSYTDSKATAGSECTYKVKALASSSTCNGDFGNTDSAVVICAAPSITVKLDSKTGKPSISWKKVTGAKSYAIYRSVNGGEYQQLTTTTAVSYKDQTAEADNQYSYYVVTLGKAAQSDSIASAAKNITLAVKAPKLSGSANTIGNPIISWTAMENAVSYKIYRSTKSNKSYTLLDTTAELSYTDSTVATGTTYYYKVVAVGANTESTQSSYLKQVGKCATPTIQVVLDEDSGKPMISWEKIEGAKKYTVYRATSETGKYSKLGTTTKLTYTDSKASVGTKYFYKIVANPSSSSANSNYSNIENGLAICAKAVITAKTDAATGKPTLSWKKVTGAKTYEIYRSENGGEYILVATQTAVTYKDTTAVAGNTYSYQVKVIASKTGADSLLSAEKTVIASCAQPKIKGKVGATGKPELTWGEVEGATKYIIYRSTSSSKGYVAIDETEDLTFTDTTAVKGKTYYYKVVVLGETTESAASSNVKVKSK